MFRNQLTEIDHPRIGYDRWSISQTLSRVTQEGASKAHRVLREDRRVPDAEFGQVENPLIFPLCASQGGERFWL